MTPFGASPLPCTIYVVGYSPICSPSQTSRIFWQRSAHRELSWEGLTRSGIEYTVHGAGCRIISSDGREVDVDLVTDPLLGREVEAFDAWRIRWFLNEAADDGYSHDDIIAACTHLASEGHLREVIGGRWFTLPDAPGGPA
ncbi:hypothetical protein U2F26_32010 [Micromonospora sp. 4G57]|uniref:DUF6896 domain-containing protein n=1 Tax=Micromonospora sicca TaxID=2202420 RepID=A0ABU5JNR1_9ACTN|nr:MULTISPECIES: hypothetical protein [unclassified Micromonospora]MDZ5447282.1 hypothetical protein [Micromonospora sp. 4G57]MDZ5494013.1 hypothetical protein [Micromonospora sp. 4G53]